MHSSPHIHPTAVVGPEAELASDVTVGPFSIIEGPVRLGPGCVVRAGAQLIGPLDAGPNNDFGRHCVIGERPQHLAYQGEPTGVVIGEGNVFRENVTIHRGMPDGRHQTVIGSFNLLLAGAHVGHDCRIGDRCILANNALLGGHVELFDRVFLSGNSAIHQCCRVGRLALMSGCSGSSKDVPPFVVQQLINRVMGVNVVGMRRAGMPAHEIQTVREAFRILYRQGKTVLNACLEIERRFGHSEAAREMLDFIRSSKRGICGAGRFGVGSADSEAA